MPTASRKKRLLALTLSLGVSLLVAEIAVRVVVGAPLRERLPLMRVRANPARGWAMVPSEEHCTYQQRVRVNALGLRGAELEEKRAGETRILFLGDSLTYGQGVADDETVPVALERALRARAPERAWSVVNAGNRAYGTAQELGLLDELGARIQPDVVLLGWYWNDVSERPIPATHEAFLPRGDFVFDTNDDLSGWSRLRWEIEQLPRASALLMLTHDLFSSKGHVYAPEVAEQGLQQLGRLLAHFAEASARLGARPIVVQFPDSHRLLGATPTLAYDERCAALARQHGLALVELLPALEALFRARGALPILAFDGHYDAEANRVMGEALAEQLLTLGVPKRDE